ncbi:MAG: filamentous hemagglutinin N-terminal domain-containing protein, partial [Betaproteobacteria bacterium]|nr:filamentous hemagglutinin N-terminal domain-containing protein [Betaproteobacteria bacterium]
MVERKNSLWQPRQKALVALVAACFALPEVHANPVGPQVVNGQASIAANGSTLSVMNTPGAVINWQGFSIQTNETTKFIQQSAASSVLNRVVTADPSVILGALQSNGRVFLINPAGILVGAGARIDVGAFVGSTLNLSNADFIAGRHNFQAQPGAGNVINKGNITTPVGGYVYLVGPNVANEGLIRTPQGETILAAGNSVRLIDTGSPGVSVEITASNNKAENLGSIIAESGRVGIVGAVVRNKGVISANQLVKGVDGKIFLRATKTATVEQGSRISADGDRGGKIEVSAQQGEVRVETNSSITAIGSTGAGGTINLQSAQGNVTVEPGAVVNASGVSGGTVGLSAAQGQLQVGGTIAASGQRLGQAQASRTPLVVANIARTPAMPSVDETETVLLATINEDAPGAGISGQGGSVQLVGFLVNAPTALIDVAGDAGGRIGVNARGDLVIGDGAKLDASGGKGGQVYIESAEGKTLVSGNIFANGDRDEGGKVRLLGEKVALFGRGRIDVSGRTGGGEVLVGGDYQGKNDDIRNATQTYVGAETEIYADAIEEGRGGKVIIWSDNSTRYYGTISARGGEMAGDGGFVEISGKNSLVMKGGVDLSAPHGNVGTLLLDPKTIVIEAGSADGRDDTDASATNLINNSDSNTLGSILLADEADSSQPTFLIYESEIEGTNANIILEARDGITTSGSFGGSEVLLMNNRSLTLRTRNDSEDGGVGINLTGSADGAALLFRTQGSGSILIQTGTGTRSLSAPISVGKLQTAGGNITLTGTDNVVSFTERVNANGGIISATGASIVADPILSSTGGTVNLTSTSIISGFGLSVSSISAANVNLVANAILFTGSAYSITATTRALIKPFSAPGTINTIQIGGWPTGNTLFILQTDLDAINSPVLQIGDSSQAWNINFGSGAAITRTNSGSNTLSLVTQGAISQEADLTVTSLRAEGSRVNLVNTANSISTFAAKSNSSSINVKSTSRTLTIGTVDGQAGIDSNTIVSINNTGTITQTAPITAGRLGVASVGGLFLDSADNLIQRVDLSNTGGGGIIFFNTTPSLDVANVGHSGAGNVVVANHGAMDVSGAVFNSGGDLLMVATGAMNTSAVIGATGNLGLFGTGLTTGNVVFAGGAITLDAGAAPQEISQRLQRIINFSGAVGNQADLERVATGAITVDWGTGATMLTINAPLYGSGPQVNLFGGNMSLNAAINNPTGAVVLNNSSGGDVSIGAGLSGLGLSNLELNNIHAASLIFFASPVTVDGPVNLTSVGSFTLNASSLDVNNSFATSGELNIRTTGMVNVNAPLSGGSVTLNSSGIVINGADAGISATSGSLNILAGSCVDCEGKLTAAGGRVTIAGGAVLTNTVAEQTQQTLITTTNTATTTASEEGTTSDATGGKDTAGTATPGTGGASIVDSAAGGGGTPMVTLLGGTAGGGEGSFGAPTTGGTTTGGTTLGGPTTGGITTGGITTGGATTGDTTTGGTTLGGPTTGGI